MNYLVLWDRARQAIAECKNIDEVKQIRDKAEALRAYAKQAGESLQAQNDIAEIKLRAERRIGEFSRDLPKDQGGNTKYGSSHDGENRTAKTSILKDAGITHCERYEAAASLPEDVFEKHIAEVKASNTELTTVGILKLARQMQRENEIETIRQSIVNQPPSINGLFDVIVIDPPWPYGREYDSEASRVANPYPEMAVEEIAGIALPLSENAVVFLWTTHAFLKHAFGLLEAWNLEYKATLVWDKEKMGMGATIRMQCEFCLLAIKGKPLLQGESTRDIIREPRREHSRKPDAFYLLVERMTIGKKLDYFSRTKREKWESYGAETGKF